MKKNILSNSSQDADEKVVIADECGDSMWDTVLGQEVKQCNISSKEVSVNLLQRIDDHAS